MSSWGSSVVSDLRHGLLWVRSMVLQCKTFSKDERKAALDLLKKFGRLSVAYGEIRHCSNGNLKQLASSMAELTGKLLSLGLDTVPPPCDELDSGSGVCSDIGCDCGCSSPVCVVEEPADQLDVWFSGAEEAVKADMLCSF